MSHRTKIAMISVAAVFIIIFGISMALRSKQAAVSTSGAVTGGDTSSSDMPRYDAAINFPPTTPASVRLDMQKNATDVEAQLAKDPANIRLWINLGTVKKIAGDYAGALEDWAYASKLDFSNPTPHLSLADLYQNNFRDYAKAEQEYRRVITLLPSDTNSYRGLFEIYSTTSYKPTNTAAEDVLKQGIAANPKAFDLQLLLARYYKQQGRAADAKAAYDAAIASATAQSQTDIAAQMKTESTQ